MIFRREDGRRRGLASVALLPVLGFAVTGCGGDVGTDTPTAEAPEGESCYEGETLTFGVAYGPGGLYDLFARALAPHLKDELGATVVVENMPGAGGLTAANQIYAAEPDGLTIGFFSGQGLAGAVLGESAGAQFDVQDFTYVARMSAADRLLVTGPEGDPTVDALQAAEGLQFASAGPGGADHIDGTVLIPVLGLDGEIVTGYAGSAETELAVTSGDADVTSGTVPSRMEAVQRGDLVPVLVIGEEASEDVPGTPALGELDPELLT